ncbi:MAG: c-type cytochrome [Desulfobaccales bacterium]
MRIFVLLVLPALLLTGSLGWGQAQELRIPDLARRLGCFACHVLNGEGGNLAASLDGVGTRLSREQLQIALTYPRQLHPGAKMPSYAYLPPSEQEALVKFMEGLK